MQKAFDPLLGYLDVEKHGDSYYVLLVGANNNGDAAKFSAGGAAGSICVPWGCVTR